MSLNCYKFIIERDVKPKKHRVTSLGEGSRIIKAGYREGISSGQNWDAIVSKNIPLEAWVAH
jgi:hypothetical protein